MEKTGKKALIISEYLAGGLSTRKLAEKCGYSRATISRWVIAERKEMSKRELLKTSPLSKAIEGMPTEVKELQEALELARLKISLLEATIDIADEQFGTNIRKKAGTRPS
jgi:transposase